jgi:tetratricopeptide (TPR) repeat protein
MKKPEIIREVKMKNLIFSLIFLVTLSNYSVTLTQEICHTKNENESKVVAENNAVANLKNVLLEDAINVIISKRDDASIELSENEREMVALSIRNMKIIEQYWENNRFFLTGEIELDLEALNHQEKRDETEDEDPRAVLERIRKYREDAENTKRKLAEMEERRNEIDPEKQQLAFENFRQARIAQTLRQYETSIYYLEKTLEYDENHPLAHYYIGIAHSILCEHIKAIRSYKKALKHDTGKDKVYFNMGISYDAINNQKKAIRAYQNAIELNPNYVQAYYNLGSSYIMNKDYKKALEAYQKVLEFNPDFTEVYFNMGFIYDEQKKYDKSIEAYQKAIALNPDYAGAYVGLGDAYDKNKQYEEAISSFQKAISLNAEDAETFIKLGNAFEAINAEDKTIEAYQNAARLGDKKAQRYLEKKEMSW